MEILKFIKCLADKTRFKLFKLLLDQKLCVCELTEILDRTQPCISQHIKKLKDLDLLIEEKDEQWIYYSIDNNKYEYYQKKLNNLKELSFTELEFPNISKRLENVKKQDLCNIKSQER